jgi:hypothetical protein
MKRDEKTSPAVEDRRKEPAPRGNVVALRPKRRIADDAPPDRDPPPDSAA